MPTEKKKRKKNSSGTGRYVFCPSSNQGPGHHGLFAIEVYEKTSTGNLWSRCPCGVRIQFDHGKPPSMTKKDAIKAGAFLPFVV